MDFKNWMLLFLVMGVVGVFAYRMYQTPVIEELVNEAMEEDNSQVAGDIYEIPADWEEYDGETLKFYHPAEWEPENREPFNGSVIEDVVLNIPDATDNSLYYSEVPYDMVKPEDIASEESIEIADREWIKWVREGEDYVSYDYYTKDVPNTDVDNFAVHVTVDGKNEKLEEDLLKLLNSIEFEASSEAEITDSPVTVSPDLSE